MDEVQVDRKEEKRLTVCRIADELKKWSGLQPTKREQYMIAACTDVIFGAPDLYVDFGDGESLKEPT